MTEVRLPKPGDAITEAEITELLVDDGATVSEGDPLYSIATDKVEWTLSCGDEAVLDEWLNTLRQWVGNFKSRKKAKKKRPPTQGAGVTASAPS